MTDYNGSYRNLTHDFATLIPVPTHLSAVTSYQATFTGIPAHVPEGFGTTAIVYFKMRALRSPFGTGFVGWRVIANPDPDGNEAPEAIVPGSAVIMARWIG